MRGCLLLDLSMLGTVGKVEQRPAQLGQYLVQRDVLLLGPDTIFIKVLVRRKVARAKCSHPTASLGHNIVLRLPRNLEF